MAALSTGKATQKTTIRPDMYSLTRARASSHAFAMTETTQNASKALLLRLDPGARLEKGARDRDQGAGERDEDKERPVAVQEPRQQVLPPCRRAAVRHLRVPLQAIAVILPEQHCGSEPRRTSADLPEA